MSAQYSVFDVAKNILRKKGPMTTMKLQKLVYYCQAWSLAWDEHPLFNENIEAWVNGPVCRELYQAHKGKYVIAEFDLPIGNPNAFIRKDEETIDAVLLGYGDKDAYWLKELTHQEDPWKNARIGCKDGEPCDAIITLESMGKYYSEL